MGGDPVDSSKKKPILKKHHLECVQLSDDMLSALEIGVLGRIRIFPFVLRDLG